MSADDKALGRYALTKPATMTFPNLLEAKAVMGPTGKPSGDPKYSVNLEMAPDHADLAAMKAKAVAVARAKWPGVDLATLRFPFADGSKLADKAKSPTHPNGKPKAVKDREFSRGKAVLTARSKYQPRLSIITNGGLVDLEGDAIAANARQFYNGVDVLAQVTFQAYDAVGEDGKPGVNAFIDLVVSLNKGKKLSGGASAAEVFKDYAGTISQEDPTAGAAALDDEIPF